MSPVRLLARHILSNPHIHHRASVLAMDNDCGLLDGQDEMQKRYMQEECILVNSQDVNIGHASKKQCHLLTNINNGMLHRAFSVFLFNGRDELLLQQRSRFKITFPEHWTNTCCSHPLNVKEELTEKSALGVRNAAQRKLKHELGIAAEQVPIESMKYLTRIQYQSRNVPDDGQWGESEIDYVLFIKGQVDITPNPNEVKDYAFVNRGQLKSLVERSDKGEVLITPWFRLIVQHLLPTWWDNLDDLSAFTDHQTIHRLP